MNKFNLSEQLIFNNKPYDSAIGVLEIIVKDKNGNVVNRIIDKNIIKIFAKEMLSHRLPSSEIWSQDSSGGSWVNSGIDPDEEYSARYILFGASFDENGTPLGTEDTRYYTVDSVTGQYVAISLDPSAAYDGGLINAIPIEEPNRPLKRIESISFSPTYQPSGNPLLDNSVRAINNILIVESTLQSDEYNGFSNTESDFFTITEVALAGGRKFNTVSQCDLNPKDLFLQGIQLSTTDSYEVSVPFVANGTNVVSYNGSDPTTVLMFKNGDQIKIVNRDGTQDNYTTLNQLNPSYLIENFAGGNDIQLDRVPVDQSNNPIVGNIGLFRNTLKIFSHRILSTPISKSASFEILIRWSIIYS